MERKRLDDHGKRRPSGAAVRRPAVTDALRRALFEEWAANGYRGLSLERVAARAGAGKAALYRRWPSKLAMVDDALQAVGINVTEVPDTGSLAGDVTALLLSFRRVLRHPLARRIIPDLHAELGRSRELEGPLATLTAARRARVMPILDRAIARGELRPGVDRALAADLVAAPLYWRTVVTRGRADRGYLDRLTAAIVAGIRASASEQGQNQAAAPARA